MNTIDCTPTWEGLLFGMLSVLESNDISPSVRQGIREEFKRMAKAADNWNAHVKSLSVLNTFDPVPDDPISPEMDDPEGDKRPYLEKLADLLNHHNVRKYININNWGYSQIERDIVNLFIDEPFVPGN